LTHFNQINAVSTEKNNIVSFKKPPVLSTNVGKKMPKIVLKTKTLEAFRKKTHVTTQYKLCRIRAVTLEILGKRYNSN
jgi:hypothetical protein